jgi:hypothetical protein
MDYGLKHIVGNLLTQTYDEIFNSPEFHRVRNNRWALDGDTLCRSCIVSVPIVPYYMMESVSKVRSYLRDRK